jgi:zinc protease
VAVRKFAQLPILMIGYKVPETAHADYYALRVLDTILFTGESSRMYRNIVDKGQLALSIQAGVDFAFDPTLYTVTAQPRAGVDPGKVEQAVYAELEKARTGAVEDQEIEKAKNILLAGFYRQMKTISGKANAIGTYEVFFGDYGRMFSAAQDFQKVTKEDIRRVAKAYFGESSRTVATLVPQEEQKQ